MRVAHVPGLLFTYSKLKLFWDRVTFSRLTTLYFLFSVLHCAIQVTLQLTAFSINAHAASFLSSIVLQGNATGRGFPVYTSGKLWFCNFVPKPFTVDGCNIIWDGTPKTDNYQTSAANATSPALDTFPSSSYSESLSTSSTVSSSFSSSTLASSSPSPSAYNALAAPHTITIFVSPSSTAAPLANSKVAAANLHGDDDAILHNRDDTPTIQVDQTANGTEVILDGPGFRHAPAVLDQSCLWALNYPLEILDNTIREDIVFIAFQFWVLGMSVVALLNESIPHILASLLTHVLATSWSAFQVIQTAQFRVEFNHITTNGACQGFNFLKHFWNERKLAEFPILGVNIFALLVSVFLTWHLIKLFGWQTFKRVGASLTINHVYKCVLVLSITIQLSLFFMVATVGLWIDQLFNGWIGQLASLATLYKATCIITLILLVPWLMMGWFAVRRELRFPMAIFLLLCVAYLAGWTVMFISTSFRWTFVQWRFFGIMASASIALTLAALILGIICRINFDKGLLRYLQAQEILSGEDPSAKYSNDNVDEEKVSFPSRDAGIPSFSVTFGTGSEVPPPSQMKFGPQPIRGGQHTRELSKTELPPNRGGKHTRKLSKTRPDADMIPKAMISKPLPMPTSESHRRLPSTESDASQGSLKTHESDWSGNEGLVRPGHSKRWIIE